MLIVSRRARSSPYPLISVDEAQKLVLEHSTALNAVLMPVSQFLASGYVLAEDVKSIEPVPGYRASVVDGYAVYGIRRIKMISSSIFTLYIFSRRWARRISSRIDCISRDTRGKYDPKPRQNCSRCNGGNGS